MTIVNGSLPFSQNYMKIHQDPTEKRFHLTLPHEIQRLSRQMRTPHSATWILHGIYGSVIAEAGFFRKIRTILLPLLHNSSVSAVLAAFGGSVFNLAITTILYPPNYSTLPVYISDSYNDLKFGYAAAATMVGGAFIMGIMMLLEVVLNAGYRKKQGH